MELHIFFLAIALGTPIQYSTTMLRLTTRTTVIAQMQERLVCNLNVCGIVSTSTHYSHGWFIDHVVLELRRFICSVEV